MDKCVFARVAAAFALGVVASATPAGCQQGAPIFWPARDLHWADDHGGRGGRIVPLWSSPSAGASGSLRRLPAGASSGPGTSLQTDRRIVTISGTLVVTIDAQVPHELSPGSFASVPAGANQTLECARGAECIYLENQERALARASLARPREPLSAPSQDRLVLANYVGQTKGQVAVAGKVVRLSLMYDGDLGDGTCVISQRPPAGTTVRRGSTVLVTMKPCQK